MQGNSWKSLTANKDCLPEKIKKYWFRTYGFGWTLKSEFSLVSAYFCHHVKSLAEKVRESIFPLFESGISGSHLSSRYWETKIHSGLRIAHITGQA